MLIKKFNLLLLLIVAEGFQWINIRNTFKKVTLVRLNESSSSASNFDEKNRMNTNRSKGNDDNDSSLVVIRQPKSHRRELLEYLGACIASALAISSYEDYDVSFNKPARGTLRQHHNMYWGSATRGMGESLQDRNARYNNYRDDNVDKEAEYSIPTYNEVMEEHRRLRVSNWRGSRGEVVDVAIEEERVTQSCSVIKEGIELLQNAKSLANDYDWDGLRALLKSPTLNYDLDVACDRLNASSQVISADTRKEIGFDWGSCAWRHCGAFADAQEAIAELERSLGMLEPFECLFCIDIIERSLMEILAPIPIKYRGDLPSVPEYQRRLSEEEDVSELDYLDALEFLKSDIGDDESDKD